MATTTHLWGWNVQATKAAEPDGDGMAEVWVLEFQERNTGSQILFSMRRETRDELVRQLTGGLVLAGGEFPKL